MDNGCKKEEVLARLKNEMNGAVAGAMEERGLLYGVNYGVSYPTIKKIAEGYFPDHELALALFAENIRESRIAAILTDNPAQVSRAQMLQWGESFETGEIACLAGMRLFYASPDAVGIICEWLGSDDGLLLRAALYMTGRRAAERLSDEEEMSASLKLIGEKAAHGIKSPDAAVYALRCIAENSPVMRTLVADVIERLVTSESESAKEMAEEVAALLSESV